MHRMATCSVVLSAKRRQRHRPSARIRAPGTFWVLSLACVARTKLLWSSWWGNCWIWICAWRMFTAAYRSDLACGLSTVVVSEMMPLPWVVYGGGGNVVWSLVAVLVDDCGGASTALCAACSLLYRGENSLMPLRTVGAHVMPTPGSMFTCSFP